MPDDKGKALSNTDINDSSARPSEAAPVEPPPAESCACASEPGSASGDDAAAGASRPIEDLMLSELIERWIRAPKQTARAFRVALSAASAGAPSPLMTVPSVTSAPARNALASVGAFAPRLRQAKTIQLLLYAIAFISAVTGSILFRGGDDAPRAAAYSINVGAPFLWLGFLLWLAAEMAGSWKGLTDSWRRLDQQARMRWYARIVPSLLWMLALFNLTASMTAPPAEATDLAVTALSRLLAGGLLWALIEVAYWQARRRAATMEAETLLIQERQPRRRSLLADISRLRKLLIGLAILCSLILWANTSGNRIEPPIITLWLLSTILWAFVFAPLRWNLFDWASERIDALRRFRPRHHLWTIAALLLILLLGAGFRFYELDAYPPQMFSDLVEKIQDAYKIRHLHDYRIFFDNIGGREPLHFYLLSILASQPGLEFNHYALKLMSALESFITLPIIFWLGVEVIGGRRRSLGRLVGLFAAALVAASFWHAMLGRQGMRISLAPLFSALTAVYLVRALRTNRRSDFVKAGLALGFGLLGYQAVRMLPLAVVAGVAVALIVGRQSWRQRLSYLVHLGVLAFVALMVFLPLFHYWLEEPEDYMRRASTRIFGDSPTTGEERAAFLQGSIPIFMSHVRKTALMYFYYGDSTWVSGMPQEPAMDPLTAACLLLGVAAWLSLALKTRDPVIVFVPFYLVATLLPTALALSFPIEVPSFIRASGAIPPSYLIAALPVAVFCRRLCTAIGGRTGFVLGAAVVIGLVLSANHYNTRLYFGEFMDNYVHASHPHAQAGAILRGFADSDGAYGNAFVLTSPHWWDIRAVGIEAGQMFWDSGGEASSAPQLLDRGLWREAKFRLQPERDLLFFYARQNDYAPALLAEWFPNGRQVEIPVEPIYKSFYIYRAPALGADGLRRFLDANL
ncbi:MAG: glycosyltransferase family 39 protein [Chloroflexi bacterium]|nr:glycosyltransferase family 39 protein [Chloroflexota bacterium]